MIEHKCPHCQGSSLYPADLEGRTTCRLCGQTFELSQFTRARPSALVQGLKRVREAAEKTRSSPATVYVVASVATLVVVWIVLSVFGFIPDEIRLVNRRFVNVDDWDRVKQAVGLVGVGVPNDQGEIAFLGYGTAWAVSNDGFMLTSKHVVLPAARMPTTPIGPMHTWVYVNKRRIDAEIAWTDVVADIALLKVDEYLPYRFKVGRERSVKRLNVEVLAVGFQAMPTAVESTVVDTELASTKGTISRVYQDNAGTRWVEHTAPLKSGSSGGPLLLGDTVIGINKGGSEGIYEALNVTVHRQRIFKVIKEWRDKRKRAGG